MLTGRLPITSNEKDARAAASDVMRKIVSFKEEFKQQESEKQALSSEAQDLVRKSPGCETPFGFVLISFSAAQIAKLLVVDPNARLGSDQAGSGVDFSWGFVLLLISGFGRRICCSEKPSVLPRNRSVGCCRLSSNFRLNRVVS